MSERGPTSGVGRSGDPGVSWGKPGGPSPHVPIQPKWRALVSVVRVFHRLEHHPSCAGLLLDPWSLNYCDHASRGSGMAPVEKKTTMSERGPASEIGRSGDPDVSWGKPGESSPHIPIQPKWRALVSVVRVFHRLEHHPSCARGPIVPDLGLGRVC
jgi:hypothetical protein